MAPACAHWESSPPGAAWTGVSGSWFELFVAMGCTPPSLVLVGCLEMPWSRGRDLWTATLDTGPRNRLPREHEIDALGAYLLAQRRGAAPPCSRRARALGGVGRAQAPSAEHGPGWASSSLSFTPPPPHAGTLSLYATRGDILSTHPPPTSPTVPGSILAQKYRVERILGQGGMGVVVQARHIALEERVALKFLLPEYADQPDASARFLREARAAVKIKSEHVARVSDVGTLETGAPYMVMEFSRGATSPRCSNHRRRSASRTRWTT